MCGGSFNTFLCEKIIVLEKGNSLLQSSAFYSCCIKVQLIERFPLPPFIMPVGQRQRQRGKDREREKESDMNGTERTLQPKRYIPT